jgi:hypothetical protein
LWVRGCVGVCVRACVRLDFRFTRFAFASLTLHAFGIQEYQRVFGAKAPRVASTPEAELQVRIVFVY